MNLSWWNFLCLGGVHRTNWRSNRNTNFPLFVWNGLPPFVQEIFSCVVKNPTSLFMFNKFPWKFSTHDPHSAYASFPSSRLGVDFPSCATPPPIDPRRIRVVNINASVHEDAARTEGRPEKWLRRVSHRKGGSAAPAAADRRWNPLPRSVPPECGAVWRRPSA